jgi:PmbA protein
VRNAIGTDRIESFCAWLLDKARKGGAVEADVFYSEGESRHVSLREGLPEEDVNGYGHSVTLRVLLPGGRQGLASVNRFEQADLSGLVEWSLANAAVSEPDPFLEIGEGTPPGENEDLLLEDPDLRSLTHERRIRACLDMTEAAKAADKRVISVRSASWSDGWGSIFLANTRGFGAWQRGTSASCGVAVVLKEGEEFEMGGFGEDSRFAGKLDPLGVALQAVRKTGMILGGTPVETGRMSVFLDPESCADFIDAIGDLFLAPNVLRNKSLLRGKLKTTVASPAFSLVDDGRLPGGMATSPFDGEGVRTRRTPLVSSGVLENYLYDISSAREAGTSPTGNATRGNGTAPDAGCSNIFPLPGDKSPEELFAEVGRGLLVTEIMGLHTINPVSGDFSLGIKGVLMEGVEAVRPVAEVTMAGNLADWLRQIHAVGNDLRFFGGTGGCTMVIDDVSVAGS